jgi:hypothetical protein
MTACNHYSNWAASKSCRPRDHGRDLFAGGSIRFPRRAGWLEEFTAELLAFPGRHDDQVDALTQGLAWGRRRNLSTCAVFGHY